MPPPHTFARQHTVLGITEISQGDDVPIPTPARPIRVRVRPQDSIAGLPLHQHPWAQLTYSLKGVMRVSTPSATWIVPPTRAIWIPPRIPHEVQLFSGAHPHTLYVDAAMKPISHQACCVIEVRPFMSSLISELAKLAKQHERTLREEALAILLLEELAQAARLPLHLPLPQDRRLRNLCEYLLHHPATTQTLAALAADCGASERTISRLFFKELGMPFTTWRTQLKLMQALTLASDGTPYQAIAQALGYQSASAFSAMFKKAFGVPPSLFLRPAKESGEASSPN
ncbi:AraC family transcriptional regulator [Parvibium lacunae]|uniref:AraC family transcriptional regulator n=1 Tax=Parvibium lacunae TaxID=1888893 RepID=A0A368L3B1_9BURK|nr:helix-turn-helix transcriptional regulator [Parvibium lacunae]RCS58044.1 AraC family transcriptional regulator [Parvibium lacunae]